MSHYSFCHFFRGNVVDDDLYGMFAEYLHEDMQTSFFRFWLDFMFT